ncbi:MAG: Eco57I restriction-modification methylase domain-containing protein [Selenomonadaceae bacterium]|nr:Eco57I restriction-modification methylase domain-containing protein [Selenomonadaceae bacterium]
METLIKSRQRVQQFGEVFTPSWMVKKMLAVPDIQAALRDPASKFLEPCCGEGAFLTEILRLKLFYHPAFPWHILRSLYGIEIQLDNLAYARKNLAQIFAAHCRIDFEDPRIWQILNKNIFHGDVLKFQIPAVNQSLFEEELILSKNPIADAFKAHFGLTDQEIKNMVIISNPPYQEDDRGDTSNYARPVYHKFLDEYHRTCERVMVIHPARCLFNAGATPKDFNEKLLSDEHVKVAVYHANSKEVFPNLDIKGGVAATYRDVNKNFGAIGTYIPYDELKLIHGKVFVSNKNFRPLNAIIYTQKLYKFSRKFYEENPGVQNLLTDGRTLKTNIFARLPHLFTEKKPDDGHEYAEIYGFQKGERLFRFFRADFIDDNINFRKYKVFIPEAYGGAGALNENGPTMLVGLPLVGCTETFVTLGAFDFEAEALAAEKYVKTKFLRALLGVKKVTQHASPEIWEYVPLQDFSAHSDIDWSRSVHEVDKQLYRKYGLDAREVAFIEAKVKAME